MTLATLRRTVAPALGLVAVALVALLVGYVTKGSEQTTSNHVALVNQLEAARGVVQEISGDRLTLATGAGTETLRLSPSTIVEVLRPASPATLREGDWLNAGAVPHEQTLFAIIGLIVIPQSQLEAPPP
jgi:hypothetical protein